MTTSFLHAPTALGMLAVNLRLVRRALDAGRVDVTLASGAVLYIRRLERELREGVVDGQAAVDEANRIARAVTQTRPDERRERRPEPAPAQRPLPSHADTLVRDPGGQWRTPTPLPVAPEPEEIEEAGVDEA
ncbi:hypothetical protein GU700_24375 [Methylobacterium sp. NI91]|nr:MULTISPECIES: hypothetical protein [unclassified Methylobacterium]QIJ77443.1 hypothetical protein CLZ_24380 [Methylobacterium sp. CLZ]QIJ82346.1 hypothetical protein GU700_24375 [Methylobacterium sp. NI91]